MLLAADVDVDIALTRVLADDHAGVDGGVRAAEQRAAILRVEQAVHDRVARFGGDQRADAAMRDIALIRLVVVKHGAHHALAAGIGHKLAAVAEQAAARHGELEAHAVGAGHVIHHAAATADLLDDGARVLAGHIGDHPLHRLELVAVLVIVEEHLRLGNLELVALTAHVLDEHGEVKLAAAADAEGIGGVGLLHQKQSGK